MTNRFYRIRHAKTGKWFTPTRWVKDPMDAKRYSYKAACKAIINRVNDLSSSGENATAEVQSLNIMYSEIVEFEEKETQIEHMPKETFTSCFRYVNPIDLKTWRKWVENV